MRNKPTIKTAEYVAKKYNMEKVVIFFFKDDQFGVASYGKDRDHCRQAGKFADDIFDQIEDDNFELTL